MAKTDLLIIVFLVFGFFMGAICERFLIKYEKDIVNYLNNLVKKIKDKT